MKSLLDVDDSTFESMVAEAADAFTNDLYAGHKPSIEAYAKKYPDIANVIRQVFPALAVMEPTDSSGGRIADFEGQPLGDFLIVREIGRGGMGVVYEAEQLSIGRRMALKVLPFASLLEKQKLVRFKNEARAAGTLDHPNIVAVHSVGEDRGIHYYAMQLVLGKNLAEVIAELRDESGESSGRESVAIRHAPVSNPPGRSERGDLASSYPPAASNSPSRQQLPPDSPFPITRSPSDTDVAAALSTVRTTNLQESFRQAALLIADAAEALDYAHNQGVIHRDIKPANLLVDDHSRIYVTDFGLARLETAENVTLTGDLLGTLRYMSPEQAAGKPGLVDYRTDIHALGATLYELLALRPAFDSADRAELLQRITNDAPPLLRQTDSRIPAYLATIVAKAMEKDPADRYDSAAAMADDLRAFAEHRPITAKPPSLATQTRKWVRRHSTAVAIAFVLLLLSSTGLAVAAAMLSASNRREIAQRNEAEANLQLAADAVDRLLAEMGRVAISHGELIQAEHFLNQADNFYRQLIGKSNQLDVLLRAAGAYNSIGSLQQSLGRHEEAMDRYRQSLRLLDRLNDAQQQRKDVRERRAATYSGMASIHKSLLSAHGVEMYANSASQIWRSLLDEAPESPKYLNGVVESLNRLAIAYMETGRFDEAETAYGELLNLSQRLPAVSRSSAAGRANLAGIKCNLATLAVERGNLEKAGPLFRQAVTAQQQVVKALPKIALHRHSLYLFEWNLIDYLIRRGDYAEAADAARQFANQFPKRLEAQYEAADFLLRCIEGAQSAEEADHATNAPFVMQDWKTTATKIIAAAKPTPTTSIDAIGYFGWFLTMARDPSLRDPGRALALVDRALAVAPERRFLHRVRGIAQYRSSDHQAAVETLEKTIRSGGFEGIDALFASMAYASLGDKEQSLHWYEEAVRRQRAEIQMATSAYNFLEDARELLFGEARGVLSANGIDVSLSLVRRVMIEKTVDVLGTCHLQFQSP